MKVKIKEIKKEMINLKYYTLMGSIIFVLVFSLTSNNSNKFNSLDNTALKENKSTAKVIQNNISVENSKINNQGARKYRASCR